MKSMKKIVRGGILAIGVAVLSVAPVFAADDCTGPLTGDYTGVHVGGDTAPVVDQKTFIKCAATLPDANGVPQTMWGRDSAACAKAASLAANPDGCNSRNLNNVVQTIVNTIIFAVGIIAVIMVIMGGIQYSTSQGDPGKVKKAKDTILYGIIGLAVAILAFAIVNFVLTSIF